jgi:hypothetical protein
MRQFLALLVAATTVAGAQDIDSGWYAGIGVGALSHDETIAPDLYVTDAVAATKLFGGFRWSSRWGLEFSYIDSSSIDSSPDGVGLLADQFSSVYSTQIAALTIRPMAYLPVSWGTLFGGLGFFEGDRRSDSTVAAPLGFGSLPTRIEATDSGATLLLGTEWPMGSLRLRAEYEWWDVERANSSSLGLGLSYRF